MVLIGALFYFERGCETDEGVLRVTESAKCFHPFKHALTFALRFSCGISINSSLDGCLCSALK